MFIRAEDLWEKTNWPSCGKEAFLHNMVQAVLRPIPFSLTAH